VRLALLGIVAALCGELRTMRAVSDRVLAIGADRGWPGSPWSQAAAAMSGYCDLLRHLPADAERRTADALATLPAAVAAAAASSPASRFGFALHAVHGPPCSTWDTGPRGWPSCNRPARTSATTRPARNTAPRWPCWSSASRCCSGTPRRPAPSWGWLTERTGDNAEDNAELVAMRAWTAAAAGHHQRARTLIRPVLDGSAPALLPHTVVEGWLLGTSIAAAADERPAARHALQTALALAEPLDALRPFIQAGPHVRELLIHQRGSFGASEQFANQLALLIHRLLPHGFTNRELRTLIAPLLGTTTEHISTGKMTYDLRRLRAHGLVTRIARTRRYQVTDTGLQYALLFTHAHDHLLRTGLAEITDPDPPARSRLRAADRAYQAAFDDLARYAHLAA
jgi:MalT-like TPR region